jgi:hypothetical protein
LTWLAAVLVIAVAYFVGPTAGVVVLVGVVVLASINISDTRTVDALNVIADDVRRLADLCETAELGLQNALDDMRPQLAELDRLDRLDAIAEHVAKLPEALADIGATLSVHIAAELEKSAASLGTIEGMLFAKHVDDEDNEP